MSDLTKNPIYIQITTEEPEYLEAPGGKPVGSDTKAPCGEFAKDQIPGYPQIAKPVEEANVSGTRYFRLQEKFMGGEMKDTCEASYDVWILAESAKVLSDIFEDTVSIIDDKEVRSIFSLLNRKVGGNLNPVETQFVSFKLKKHEAKVYAVSIVIGAREEQWGAIVLIDQGKVHLLSCEKIPVKRAHQMGESVNISQAADPSPFAEGVANKNTIIRDIDGDGKLEMITSSAERAMEYYQIFTWRGDHFENVFSFESMDEPKFKDPFLEFVDETSGDDPVKKRYKFYEGTYHEVSDEN